MDAIPALPALDSTLAFLSDGYTFISKGCRQVGADAFRTRLMGRPVVCMLGADASRTFWSGGRFDRHGSIPPTATHLLQDEGSSQTLEGEAHRHRKLMFLEMLEPAARERMQIAFRREWDTAVSRWQYADGIVLHDELQGVLARTALSWAGLDLEASDADARTRELSTLVENAGSFGPRNWASQVVRWRSERWARTVIESVRSGALDVAADAPVVRVATQTDVDGEPLPIEVAGVELLNTIRPVVAISRFVVFAALCLHRIPRWQHAFENGDDDDLPNFVTEVRRHAPFFPAMGGRARVEFSWNGHVFSPGDWALLDLYGTNHDPRIWSEPNRFRPERFRDWPGDPYTLIPQGGGDYVADHRCAGEPVTIDLMQTAVKALTRSIAYDVPDQDLRVSLRRFPAGPASGFRISDVRRRATDWASSSPPA